MTEKLTKLVWDGNTDTWSEIELSAEEITQREVDALAFAEAEAIRQAEADAQAEAKASAVSKLAALGLSEDEIKAITN